MDHRAAQRTGERLGRGTVFDGGGRLVDVQGLILDFDGLILDTESTARQTWEEEFALRSVRLPPQLWASLLGHPHSQQELLRALARMLPAGAPPPSHGAWAERNRQLAHTLTAAPGVVELITAARRHGIPLAVASSATSDWVVPHLDRLGLTSRFEVVVTGDTLPHKPAPDIYLAAVAGLDIDAAALLAFEDSPPGLRAAKAAGVFCLGITGAHTDASALRHADAVRASLLGLDRELFPGPAAVGAVAGASPVGARDGGADS